MKKYKHEISILVITLLALAIGIAAIPQPTTIGLAWEYPTNYISFDTNLVFNVHESTDINVTISSWQMLTQFYATNITTTNLDSTGTNYSYIVRIPITAPGRMFYFVTVSNFWSESPPSTIVSTPPLPFNNIGLQINR